MLTPDELQKLQEAKIGESPTSPVSSPYKSLSDELAGTPTQEQPKTFVDKAVDVAKNVGGAIISSEKNFADSISAAATNVLPKDWTGVGQLEEAQKLRDEGITIKLKGLKHAQETGGDTQKWLKMIAEDAKQPITKLEDLYPALKKSNLQVAGEAGGVLLDILSAGSYGTAAKGAKTGELLTTAAKKETASMASQKSLFDWADKTGAAAVVETAKKTTPQILKEIGANTMKRVAVGAGTGYAYDVANNLQEGKTGKEAVTPGFGTAVGGTVPALVGLYETGRAITKTVAPRIINSLVKPRQAEFAYGKDPGRTVAQLGITANSMDDFGEKVSQARKDFGTMLGGSYQAATDQGVKLDVSDEIAKLDKAISDAVDGGANNQGMADTLKNIKDSLLYKQTMDSSGKIVNADNIPKDLTQLTPNQALDLKTKISGQTKFTGNPSDDKYVNTILKNIYGGIKEKINEATKGVSPEIPELNEKYADLLSAESAIKHRNDIARRADLISMPYKIGTVVGMVSAFKDGAVSVESLLAAAVATVLGKALASVPVKTRVAAWLGKTDPGAVRKVLESNPQIAEVLYRTFPKMGAILGQ